MVFCRAALQTLSISAVFEDKNQAILSDSLSVRKNFMAVAKHKPNKIYSPNFT
jgi:hypothetical protein